MSTITHDPLQNKAPLPQQVRTSKGCLGWGLGCGLLALLGGLLTCGGAVAGIVLFVFGVLKSTEPYQQSLRMVSESDEVQEVIGSPIEPSWILTGSVNLDNNSGTAALNYDVSGPEGSASVSLQGTKVDGRWGYESLTVTPKNGGESIDLTDEINSRQ